MAARPEVSLQGGDLRVADALDSHQAASAVLTKRGGAAHDLAQQRSAPEEAPTGQSSVRRCVSIST